MGMISSEALAQDLGLSHKAVKGLILKYKVRAIPSGSSHMDAGDPQRMVLVDSDSFHIGLKEKANTLERKKKQVAENQKAGSAA